jgi:hypothetical protein
MNDSKGCVLGCNGTWEGLDCCYEKRKAGASPRTPSVVIYEVKYSKNYENVKPSFFAANFAWVDDCAAENWLEVI